MIKYLVDTLLQEWGASKTVQFVVIPMAAATVAGSIVACTVPNKPTINSLEEKESN